MLLKLNGFFSFFIFSLSSGMQVFLFLGGHREIRSFFSFSPSLPMTHGGGGEGAPRTHSLLFLLFSPLGHENVGFLVGWGMRGQLNG